MRSQTVFDAYSKYLEATNKSVETKLRSILGRFLVPHWGGQAPKGSEATTYERRIAAEEILKKTPVKSLVGSDSVLEQVFETEGVDKQNRKVYRSYYKAFLKWAEENDYFSIEQQEFVPNQEAKLFTKPVKHKSNHHGLSYKNAYALMALSRQRKLMYEDDYVNERLKQEIKDFEDFRRDNNCSVATIKKDTKCIYQILGWLHRYKDIPLESLSLHNIINHQNLSVRQAAVELSKENIKLIEEYLGFVGGHPTSRVHVLVTCISLAKFVFRNDLDDDYLDESDFPIVKRLNLLRKKLNEKAKRTPSAIPYSQKSIPWESVYPLLEKLRQKACTNNYTSFKNGKECYALRQKSAVFNDLQIFLSLAFMTLIPPDRSRTFYDLEIGRTLVKGVYENDRFTPFDKLAGDKANSKWYIHLQPGDYKTGKAYGEFWGEIQNYKFSDETLFYDYIQKWIDEGRECEQKCDHKFFFRQDRSYGKLNVQGWGKRIKNIFYAETGVPVTPKELRKMYVTYLKDQGVSEAELEAAAYWQKHSRQMQSKVYDQQNKAKKMAPIQNFNQRVFDKNFPNLTT